MTQTPEAMRERIEHITKVAISGIRESVLRDPSDDAMHWLEDTVFDIMNAIEPALIAPQSVGEDKTERFVEKFVADLGDFGPAIDAPEGYEAYYVIDPAQLHECLLNDLRNNELAIVSTPTHTQRPDSAGLVAEIDALYVAYDENRYDRTVSYRQTQESHYKFMTTVTRKWPEIKAALTGVTS